MEMSNTIKKLIDINDLKGQRKPHQTNPLRTVLIAVLIIGVLAVGAYYGYHQALNQGREEGLYAATSGIYVYSQQQSIVISNNLSNNSSGEKVYCGTTKSLVQEKEIREMIIGELSSMMVEELDAGNQITIFNKNNEEAGVCSKRV